jgi:hypothetical protein
MSGEKCLFNDMAREYSLAGMSNELQFQPTFAATPLVSLDTLFPHAPQCRAVLHCAWLAPYLSHYSGQVLPNATSDAGPLQMIFIIEGPKEPQLQIGAKGIE